MRLGWAMVKIAAISRVRNLDSQEAGLSPENRFGYAFVCLLSFKAAGRNGAPWHRFRPVALSLSERPDKDGNPFWATNDAYG